MWCKSSCMMCYECIWDYWAQMFFWDHKITTVCDTYSDTIFWTLLHLWENTCLFVSKTLQHFTLQTINMMSGNLIMYQLQCIRKKYVDLPNMATWNCVSCCTPCCHPDCLRLEWCFEPLKEMSLWVDIICFCRLQFFDNI